MSADLVLAVEEHRALFNECVCTGDWAPFLATFTDDARMSFPCVGATTRLPLSRSRWFGESWPVRAPGHGA
jgi:hypothetical protein